MKEEIKGLKVGVNDIQRDTADMKKQMKMLQEAISKTNIASPEAPIPGELYLFCFCLS